MSPIIPKTTMDAIRAEYKHPSNPETEKLKASAQQFEAILLKQLFQAMDKTTMRDESGEGLLSGGKHESTFREMFYDEVGKSYTSPPKQQSRAMGLMLENLPQTHPSESLFNNTSTTSASTLTERGLGLARSIFEQGLIINPELLEQSH